MSEPCPTCKGTGKVTAGFMKILSGFFKARDRKNMQPDVKEITCPSCNGSGKK